MTVPVPVSAVVELPWKRGRWAPGSCVRGDSGAGAGVGRLSKLSA